VDWIKDSGSIRREAGAVDEPGSVVPALADQDDRFQRLSLFMELREKPFEPQPSPRRPAPGLGPWHTEAKDPLALPAPDSVEAAELHAVVEGLETTNALRVFLQAPGQRWRAIADLHSTKGGEHVIEPIWHGIDPRVMVPGSRLRLEIVYFPEGRTSEQSARIRFVTFRWTPAKSVAGSPR
jgi:hypothetical protein